MSTINISRKKRSFSLLALFALLFAVASISFGTIGYSADSPVIENGQEAMPSSKGSRVNSILKNTNFLNYSTFTPNATFVVNNNGDSNDAVPGDGICADSLGNCTLRAAIQEANAKTGTDEITFDFDDPTTIQLSPTFTPAGLEIYEAVTINGPGARLLTVKSSYTTVADIFYINYPGAAETSISGITITESGRFGINNPGKLNLSDVAVTGNRAGITSSGTLNLNRVTVSFNTTGGMFIAEGATANISNTTITGNSTLNQGAGIYSSTKNLTLNNVTISNNTATAGGGGLYYDGSESGVYVRNSIIANNNSSAGADVLSAKSSDGHKFVSRGNNLIGRSDPNMGFTNGENNDKVGTNASPIDPKLGPLQNNGGQIDTRALLSGSPAKDAGNICVTDSSCQTNNPSTSLTTDLRGTGFPRKYQSAVDIGAFETFYPVPSIGSFSPSDWGTGRGELDLIVKGSNFVVGSVAEWNGQERATTFVSNTELKVKILASDVQTSGEYAVKVSNPDPNDGDSPSVDFPVADCTYSLNPTSQNFTPAGGNSSFTVSTRGGCNWTATTSDSWITINNGTGKGNGTVTFTVAANSGQARTGTINVNGAIFTINQGSTCSYTLSSVSANFEAAGGNGNFTVTATAGCNWTATTGDSWITVNNGTGSGTGTVTFTVAANTGPQRTGTITVAGQTFTITQGSSCNYSLSPTSANIPVGGGNGNFNVTTANGCAWTATTGDSWITINNGTGTGNGTVTFTVAANAGQARTGTITVGGQTFTINQEGACNYNLSSTSANMSAASGSGSVSVITANGCSWTAVSNSPWITVTGVGSGTGNGTVNFTVDANTGQARTGTITIGGKTFTINQASGCAFTLSAPSIDMSAGGGSGSVNVTAGNGCAWTATKSESWITITSGASGNGNGTVNFTVAPNTGPARSGTITINGQTFTINQANGCTFTISPTSQNFNATGGTGSFTVTASNGGCTWTATKSESWITITSGASGTGNGTVNFTVAANNSTARSGTITVGDKTFTISQASGCTITLTPTGTSFDAAGGSGSFNVTTSNPACTWTAAPAPQHPWITINGSASGTGNGVVSFTVQANVSPARTGTITVGGQTFTINQGNGCTFSIAPTETNIPAGGGNSSFNVNSGAGCTWTAATSDSWITITKGSTGTGSNVVEFSVAPNIGPERTGTITVNGKTFKIIQANGCTFTLSSSSKNVPAGGEDITVNVTAISGCAWTAKSNDSWIKVTEGEAGSGNGTVKITVEANIGPERKGTLTIGGKTFTINQANGCTYTLSPTNTSVNENGGTRSFNISSGPGCTWTAVSNDQWITITAGAAGSGNGTVTFTVAANSGATREGTITAGGQTFTVYQVSLIVSNLNNSGTGSLRQAILNANNTAGNDVITFAPSVGGMITLTSGEIEIANNGTLEIKGPGTNSLTISGGGNSRIFYINGATVTISDVTLTGGNGVGVDNTENTKNGGAIYSNLGSVTLNRVYFWGNNISAPAGQGINGLGAGLYVYGGQHLIQNSSFSDNSATYGAGYFNQSGSVTIVSSTFSGNIASREGGAIYTAGNTTLRNTTISHNKAGGAEHSGAGIMNEGGTLNMRNTIISANTGAEITFAAGSVVSAGNNLIGNAPGDSANTKNLVDYRASDIRDVPPRLAVLDNYGGTIQTVALMPGSPAINAGNNVDAPATDQRGAARIVSDTIDIGAFEFNITFTPVNSVLPDASLGVHYYADIKAARVNGNNPSEPFEHFITDGFLPPGMTLLKEGGLVSGVPTQSGTYTFTIKAIGTADRTAGANQYSISIGCSYSITPSNQSFNAAGGNGTINLTATQGCGWTATSNVPWITINSGNNGTGNGTVSFTVAANAGALRTGLITAGGQLFTVSQAAGATDCTYSLTPANTNVSAAGGPGSFNVSSGSGCAWTATSNASWITVSGDSSGTGNGSVNFTVAANTGSGRSGTITAAGKTFTINQAAFASRGVQFDFDGDRKTDLAIYRPSAGEWWYLRSGDQTNRAFRFGLSTDKIVPADYTGDGKTDVAFFRPSTNEWFILRSEDFSFYSAPFGAAGDIPAPADYDGDGKADLAVFRPSEANWYINRSSGGFSILQFGAAGDIPVPSDFDGDSKADLAVYRPSAGEWWILRSSDSGNRAFQFGNSTDKPVAADYTGDGKTDVAFYRPSTSEWYILRSEDGSFYSAPFGATGDIAIPGDYDGDGKADIAVWRSSDTNWYVAKSTGGFSIAGFGSAGDKPIPNAFIP